MNGPWIAVAFSILCAESGYVRGFANPRNCISTPVVIHASHIKACRSGTYGGFGS